MNWTELKSMIQLIGGLIALGITIIIITICGINYLIERFKK